ncbi:MAG TPA: 16S rRNA (guanine(966)-N(2))-methyltransferase RsmD [Rhodoferax sp.]|uniref:16S rRNA (guanine(966)-N(2))-methyltransferase RsmD n=1 Tax=Rhodoferax sp. TaxID=50421 RepID=UPI000A6717F3|nr:16S rRNA (guanine(966)-N(2))-methyltransferase RsmD [Rhodoferax sp.]HCX81791.1 16S rRNA (guanine(966)-N(2))-methyltransferase RsmD [Rhodoferax sp.]
MKAKATSPNAAKRPPRPRAAQTHEIRIIGGLWKRTKLKVADKPGLRPTPDRVRETVFNWLGQDLSGLRCLDAFAGTGALGFEAASRGAQEVQLVEYDSALADQLKKTQAQLQASAVHVVRGDGVSAIRQAAPGSLDVIFIDPPFDAPLFEPALGACARALAPEGWVYLEAPSAYTDELLTAVGLTVHRHLKAGAVHAHLLKRSAA